MPVNYGLLTKAGAPVSGVFQVGTATVIGAITTAGNATVIVTAAGMTGSPITLPVAVALNDTDAQVAAKIRAALLLSAVIAAFFTVGGAGANVILTRTTSAADDATLNVSIDNGTCAGLTTAATSTTTTAGVRGDYRGSPTDQPLIDTANQIIYRNSGTLRKPIWSEV